MTATNDTVVENSVKIMDFFDNMKFRGRITHMSEWIFQVQPKTQYQIHYWQFIVHLKIRCLEVKQDAQLSQRDRAAGCVTVFAKSRRLELGDNILRTF